MQCWTTVKHVVSKPGIGSVWVTIGRPGCVWCVCARKGELKRINPNRIYWQCDWKICAKTKKTSIIINSIVFHRSQFFQLFCKRNPLHPPCGVHVDWRDGDQARRDSQRDGPVYPFVISWWTAALFRVTSTRQRRMIWNKRCTRIWRASGPMSWFLPSGAVAIGPEVDILPS